MKPSLSADAISTLCAAHSIEIVSERELPGRAATYAPIPPALDPRITALLTGTLAKGLYSHQSSALDSLLNGRDVCLATSTASGKSLVFTTYGAHVVLTQPGARVLCLYPARALIQDQLLKWGRALDNLGITHGHIDGGVDQSNRLEILRRASVVLMTPDVAHAWLMSNLKEPGVHAFAKSVRLLVLDEAHVYDGVFGTNMSFFLRRFQVASGAHQVVVCTATLGKPDDFVTQLTGRRATTYGPEDDGSAVPPKTLFLAAPRDARKMFDLTVKLLRELATMEGRFLAFADSRKAVELIVAAAQRKESTDTSEEDDDLDIPGIYNQLLPYRAGYEAEDRRAIQEALSQGDLRGVVSTSAMELGLDIGEIDLIVLLDVPASSKSFWQRVGRAGRRRAGICLILDPRGVISQSDEAFATYIGRPLEPSWLYLENKYIQFANALCAASELRQLAPLLPSLGPYDSAPPAFRGYLQNELNPTEAVEPDLYPLKQRAQGGPPQYEFPIRSGIEQDFRVIGPMNASLGSLTFSQALREGYPGGVYYYMARAFRVYQFNFHSGEIRVKREKRLITEPISQVMVFPRFDGGILSLQIGSKGFVAEASIQVSERVIGFVERRGSAKSENLYGPHSPFFQRDLNRFFETTGVCWFVPDKAGVSEGLASLILEHYCLRYGVQERDVGAGIFHTKTSPLDGQTCQGMCIFDATSGSLRLTQRLADNFRETIQSALEWSATQPGQFGLRELRALEKAVGDFRAVSPANPSGTATEPEWLEVLAPGSKAMYLDGDPREVVIKDYRYTPKGLLYELVHANPSVRWSVMRESIQPIFGVSTLQHVNFVTGEVRREDPDAQLVSGS